MATTEKSAERIALEETAKKLGIKAVHLCGDEKLKEKIDMAKSVESEPERKFAPKMTVAGLSQNSRTARAKEVEDNTGCKVIYKKAGTTTEQLKALGLQFTGDYHKNDMICVTDKDSFVEWQNAKKKEQRRMMDSIDSIGNKIKSHNAHAKTPVDQDEE